MIFLDQTGAYSWPILICIFFSVAVLLSGVVRPPSSYSSSPLVTPVLSLTCFLARLYLTRSSSPRKRTKILPHPHAPRTTSKPPITTLLPSQTHLSAPRSPANDLAQARRVERCSQRLTRKMKRMKRGEGVRGSLRLEGMRRRKSRTRRRWRAGKRVMLEPGR